MTLSLVYPVMVMVWSLCLPKMTQVKGTHITPKFIDLTRDDAAKDRFSGRRRCQL